ncbi:MAG: class I SAM-dependent RNA methyltransferase [Chloroflexi bacterium]|nr:class I SAM-dependent RNA methyltransferase [Chloroflexota bacterium]
MSTYFVVTSPGLDQLAAQELSRLDIIPTIEPGGVSFKSDEDGLYRANLHLRTASRILARVGQFFYATAFSELREKASRLPWERFIRPGQPVDIRVTCHKSKLIHTDAVAERIAGAIYDRLGQESPMLKASADEAVSTENHAGTQTSQLIVVRVVADQVIVSMDSSGELLHRRGYRQAVAKAPLRETLAAAMLLASGWDGRSPLMDPFCGSGTIPIEAALISAGIPPGINRRFAFMDWPGYTESRWQAILAEHHPPQVAQLPIFASDRDAGAMVMSKQNAARAGVEQAIHFACQAVSAITPPTGPGWVVTNPPYGMRISEGRDLRNLYAQLGNVLRAHCRGWNVAILSSDLVLLGHTGLKLDTNFSMINGGVNVRLGRGRVD